MNQNLAKDCDYGSFVALFRPEIYFLSYVSRRGQAWVNTICKCFLTITRNVW